MDEVGIEPTSSIGDALAMRPLRKIPAGILLPLAELILGIRDFALCGERPGAHGSQANRGPRKPLKRLDLNFYIIINPTECVTLALALRSREQTGSVCAEFAKKQTSTICPSRSQRLLFSQSRRSERRRSSRTRPRGLRAFIIT